VARRRAWSCPTRPVTPEVAGSSPVAPAETSLQIGIFCCQVGRERPPASACPALMPHVLENVLFAGVSSRRSRDAPVLSRARILTRRESRTSLRSGTRGRRLMPTCRDNIRTGADFSFAGSRIRRRGHRRRTAASEKHKERDKRSRDDHAEADQNPVGQPDCLLNSPEHDVRDPRQGRSQPEDHS
jgi:hypothetical protein